MALQILDNPPRLDTPLGHTSACWEALGLSNGTPVADSRREWVECMRNGMLPASISESIDIQTVADPDGTTKFLIRLPDGLETESVVLPLVGKEGRLRHTLCLSSQVGCAMGCEFCETAQMGLLRNLTTEEILLQWHVATHTLGHEIRNIVFMGMGEPLDNVESVIMAIRILTDRRGPSLSSARISVSTVGRLDGIQRLSEFISNSECSRLRLAISINAPDDETRSRIMPLNRAMNMAALHDTLSQWCKVHPGPLLLEYVLIPGVNDTTTAATELARWVGSLPARINVIPYNPRRDSPWPAPENAAVDEFVTSLREAGLTVHRRVTQGRSLMAACGQLGNEHIRKRRRIEH